jgi:signal transduction histidine kinase
VRAEALAAELRATNLALREARERERELAAAEERVRLAHDIHDGLGHHLTVLNVQLQAADKLITRDPERAAAAIALSRAEAQAALAEVRRSVAAMRRAPLDGQTLPEAMAALVRDFDRASPLETTFTLDGAPLTLGPAATMTLYRTAQEGLTNTQKHAAATTVQVLLRYRPDEVQVRVQDNGQGAPTPGDSAGGFGLVGLRERVERLNGTLSAGPEAENDGFVLEVILPTQGGAYDPDSTGR